MLYGNKNFDNNMNISIVTATIKLIKVSEKFDHNLFKVFDQEVRCITTRIFALMSYIFHLTIYK